MFNNLLLLAFVALFPVSFVSAGDKKPAQEYYQIRVYHFASSEQEKILDDYLAKAYIPGLHKAGIKKVGVFKALTNDTTADKKLYVFFAAASLEKLGGLTAQLQKDSGYAGAAREYMDAEYNHPPFVRMENILLKAFPLFPTMKSPAFTNDKKERVYELRSYEGPTEKLYNNKVKMFNEGGEIPLFNRLGFNAVFYSEVISGSRMPNLMYMTSFENKTERDAHWKAFNSDPEWKGLSGRAEYQHNVSKADIMLLTPAEYSDF